MQPDQYAPIALFIYNRPDHVERTIAALLKCRELQDSPLHVFCDGAKNPEDNGRVSKTRSVAKEVTPSHAQFHFSETNRGLAASIVKGVSLLCDEFGTAIVLEDDLVVGCEFLAYMNAALARYEMDERVMQVSGFMFSVESVAQDARCSLLPVATSWGWATWKESWEKYDPLASGWEALKVDSSLRKNFNLRGTFDYFSMLKQQMEGKSDSWAIRWYWSIFRNGGLIVYPPSSMVQNIGFDGSGTHGWRAAKKGFVVHDLCEQSQFRFPESSECDEEVYSRVLDHLRKMKNRPIARLKRLVKKIF